MRLLLIEDNAKVARALVDTLRALEFAVDHEPDGTSGLEAALVEEYDVILLDIGLPDIDGLEVCRRLRDQSISTPILMLTARDHIQDKITGLNHGADDYVVKPFDFDELVARIRALVRRNAPQKQTQLSIDSLILDTTSQIVTRKQKRIKLASKEFTLLNYFMHHPNEVLSKQTLLEHVWGSDIDPFSNVIDVYIGYVRKKIDKAFPNEKPLLHTIKGSGYKLSETP